MGFFSADCLGCGHPLLPLCSTDEGINVWMSDAVVLCQNGDRVSGEYDGYGRVGGWEDDDSVVGFGGACWHRACWTQAGKPAFTEESKGSRDQGYFFDEGAHDMLEPGVEHAEGALEAAQARRAARRQDHAEREAIRKAFDDADWAAWEIEDEERRQARQDALKQLKADFRGFARQQPDVWTLMVATYGKDRSLSDDLEVSCFGQWFDSMRAQAQVDWLTERQFEVKHFVPGKTESDH